MIALSLMCMVKDSNSTYFYFGGIHTRGNSSTVRTYYTTIVTTESYIRQFFYCLYRLHSLRRDPTRNKFVYSLYTLHLIWRNPKRDNFSTVCKYYSRQTESYTRP
jgi:hypothetical protein